MKLSLIVPTLAIVALASGCGSSNGAQCKVGADCASGACGVDGQCVAVHNGGDASVTDGSAGDGATQSDAGANGNDAGGDGATAGCIPNHDGVIDRAEVTIVPGLHAKFRVATNATWSTAGAMGDGGGRVWDLSTALANDHDVEVDTLTIAGAWYEPQFTGSSYATPLSATADLLGVFQWSDTALSLRGVVSPMDGAQKTELSYSPSVATLQFPLKLGASWSTNAQVSGTADGVPSVYSESYATKVDATGQLTTPFGSFAVQRVAVVLTRLVGAVATVTRSYVFVAECFGPIATVVSQTDETNTEFTNIAEARRLAP